MQKLLQRSLASMGCKVDLARDGDEGLSLWERNDYDLVLTDFNLPGMDGSELAARIRRSRRPKAQSTPVIAMTGHADDEIVRSFAEAGVNDYLGKPFTPVELRRVLQPWLPGSATAGDDGAAPAPDPASDSAIRQHIARLFIDTVPEYLQELKRACAGDNAEVIRDAAHKLKSAARLVGGDAVADLCQALESAARHADVKELAEIAAPIPGALEAFAASLSKSLRRQRGDR